MQDTVGMSMGRSDPFYIAIYYIKLGIFGEWDLWTPPLTLFFRNNNLVISIIRNQRGPL